MLNPFVVFDRDGTLIKHVHYLSDPNGVELLPNSIQGLLLLKENGFKFGIVSNQSIIKRGLATVEQVESVNSRVAELLSPFGLTFEFILYCPHLPGELCSCRKPEPALGLAAINKYKIDKNRSFMVGDQLSDVTFGHAIGFQSIQVGDKVKRIEEVDFAADDILSAAVWIVSKIGKQDKNNV
jgi:histidinol-phosphate phosphatase family protein